MDKQTIQFATVTEGNRINKVGRSSIIQPKIQFKGGSVKWFDDSKLLKKGGANNGR